ncbi:MAG: hypothetical protein JJLCMIEE_02605 [Acidimicrobiales bacterium]|nr:MAG: hypothetical protein EDR02_09510 [Actinomycetota bacterium]MBV6509512.1 hypothetical protein [Acidimicrobiales bacterium]RIK06617.1 MAG: hypothetical protein DCC48_06835 [Acidobacteriota bacterium]
MMLAKPSASHGRHLGSSSLVLRNTVVNGVAALSIGLVALVMTPVLLHHLGASEYGVWVLATTLTFEFGYLRLADVGLQPAIIRYVAEGLARDSRAETSETVSTSTVFLAVVGTLLALTLAAAAPGFTALFNVEDALTDAATLTFLIVGLQIVVDLLAVSYVGALEGAQAFVLLRVLEVGTRVAWAAVSIMLVIAGHGVVALAVVSLATAILKLVFTGVLARSLVAGVRAIPIEASLQVLGRLLSYGGRTFSLKVLAVIHRQMDRLILGFAVTTVAVASYEIVYKVHATAAILLTIAPAAVAPAAAFTNVRGDKERLRALYLRGSRYMVGVCLPLMVAALVLAETIVVAWVGPQFAGLTFATQLFLLYPMLVLVNAIGSAMFVSMGRAGELLVPQGAAVAVNLVVSIILVGRFGVVGVVWGSVSGGVVQFVPLVRRFTRVFGVRLRTWLTSLVLPVVPVVAIQVVAAAAAWPLARRATSIWQAGMLYVVIAGIGVAAFAVVIGSGERRELVAAIRRRTGEDADAGVGSIGVSGADG